MTKKRNRLSRNNARLHASPREPVLPPTRAVPNPPPDDSPAPLPILAVIGLVALALRLANLSRPMDYDESFTFLHYAANALSAGLSDYSLPNNHLFHTLLVHLSFRLLGNHPWVLRLPAFLAGLALVPATYFWVRRLFHGRAALLAAAFVASSEPLVLYSTNARGYTILGLCFVLALLLAARLLRRNGLRDWILFVAICTAGFYTIPTMIYGFGAIVLWLGIEAWRGVAPPARGVLLRNTGFAILAVAGLTAAAYAPIWLRSGFGALTASAFQPVPWPQFGREIAASFQGVWREWNQSIPMGISAGLALCFGAAVIFHRRFSSYRLSPVIPALLWPALLLLVQRTVPFSRVWLYLLPLYFGTASAGAAALLSPGRLAARTRRLVLACAVAGVIFGLGARVFLDTRSLFRDSVRVDRICDFLATQLRPGDFIGAHGYWATPIAYYLLRAGFPVDRKSTDWSLEILQVVDRPAGASPADPRQPRAFFVIRSSDADTFETLKQRASAAGVVPERTVVRRFGDTTLYEETHWQAARAR